MDTFENNDIISDITENVRMIKDVIQLIRKREEMKIKEISEHIPNIMNGIKLLGELDDSDIDD